VHAEGGSSHSGVARLAWHFHRSAYTYYAKHHASGRRAALRPLAGALLGARLVLVLARRWMAGTGPQTASPTKPMRAPRGAPIRAR